MPSILGVVLGLKGEVYRDGQGEWRWRLIARNGEKVADSSEGYKNQKHATQMCSKVTRAAVVRVIYSKG